MIDLAYIIESADYRMYRACPEIMTPDVKPYKPVLRIKYQKPRRSQFKDFALREMVREKIVRGHHRSRKTGA